MLSNTKTITNAIEKKVSYHQTVAKYFLFLFVASSLVSAMGIVLLIALQKDIIVFSSITVTGLLGMIEATIMTKKHSKKVEVLTNTKSFYNDLSTNLAKTARLRIPTLKGVEKSYCAEGKTFYQVSAKNSYFRWMNIWIEESLIQKYSNKVVDCKLSPTVKIVKEVKELESVLS